ncbi:MAG: T9SS type A sorting domain-containing protein [Flavobacteriales bacterium]|nr:T9SS type A sorting domain-containing protein [Flavobacteriales bacterium]
MKKILLSFIMLVNIGIYSIQAQITIDDTHLINVGDDVVQAHDTLPVGVSIGFGGANQTWDYSAVLDEDGVDTLRFRTPAGATGASNYPLANMVLTDTGQDSAWTYLTKNTGGLFIVGQSQFNNGQLINIPFAATIITFPSTMGTNYAGSWNGTLVGFDVSTITLLGLDSLKVTRGSDATSNIDGWGDVITPFGTFASLRQIVYQEDIDTTWEKSSSTGMWSIISPTTISTLGFLGVTLTDISYDTTRTARWWTDDASSKFVLVEMDYEANGTVNNVDWQKSAPTVGINDLMDNKFEVTSYPNPATTEIIITSNLANNSIKILNVTGKLVFEKRFITSQIRLSVSDLDNGIYFYNIYDVEGAILYSNKFVVAK